MFEWLIQNVRSLFLLPNEWPLYSLSGRGSALCPLKPTVHHARGVGEEEEARIHRDDLSSLSIFHSFLPRAVLENYVRHERIHLTSR